MAARAIASSTHFVVPGFLLLTFVAGSGPGPTPAAAQTGSDRVSAPDLPSAPVPPLTAADPSLATFVSAAAPIGRTQEDTPSAGTSRAKAALIGGAVGFVVGGGAVWGVLERETGLDDLSEDTWRLVDGPTFWKAVGIGAAVGAVVGGVVGATAFGPYGDAAHHRVGPLDLRPRVGTDRVGSFVLSVSLGPRRP